MAHLRDIGDDHIFIVGNGPTAIAWTAALRRLVPAALVTPTTRIYDPYFAGALVAGYPVEAFVRDVDEFLPIDGYLVADPIDIDADSITMRSPDGAVRTVGFKALLCTPSYGLYDGIVSTYRETAGDRAIVDATLRHQLVERLLESDEVTVVGRWAPALSLAVELATRSGHTRFRFASGSGDGVDRIDEAATRLWRRLSAPADEHQAPSRNAAPAQSAAGVRSYGLGRSSGRGTVVSLNAPAAVTGDLDRFSRIGSFERVFGVSDEELTQPRGALFTNLLTCAYATGRFPLTFHRHRYRPLAASRRARVYASAQARSAFAGRGPLRARRGIHPLERRMHVSRSFLMQLQIIKEVATV